MPRVRSITSAGWKTAAYTKQGGACWRTHASRGPSSLPPLDDMTREAQEGGERPRCGSETHRSAGVELAWRQLDRAAVCFTWSRNFNVCRECVWGKRITRMRGFSMFHTRHVVFAACLRHRGESVSTKRARNATRVAKTAAHHPSRAAVDPGTLNTISFKDNPQRQKGLEM